MFFQASERLPRRSSWTVGTALQQLADLAERLPRRKINILIKKFKKIYKKLFIIYYLLFFYFFIFLII